MDEKVSKGYCKNHPDIIGFTDITGREYPEAEENPTPCWDCWQNILANAYERAKKAGQNSS